MTIAKALKATLAALVFAGSLALAPVAAHAAVFLSVGVAPPPIPVYTQPIAPGYGYIWTPGYWAWGDDGWYWVDGAWVYPPYEDALWTPGYWGWDADLYYWHPGYWGRTIGYYGGINYGFGYFGTGFYGGYWNGGHFFYNRAYNHLGFRDHDHDRFVYNQRVRGFDGRPGGSAFTRNDVGFQHGVNRGAGVNGRTFENRGGSAERSTGFANRGNVAVGEHGSFANRPAYNANNGFANRGNAGVTERSTGFSNGGNRPAYNGNNGFANRGNEGRQSFNNSPAFRGNEGRQSFGGGAAFSGRASAPSAAPAQRGNFNAGSRGNFSAPQGGSRANFGGGGHANFGGGNGGGHASFGGGGGGGFHGGGGGGGSHGGGRR